MDKSLNIKYNSFLYMENDSIKRPEASPGINDNTNPKTEVNEINGRGKRSGRFILGVALSLGAVGGAGLAVDGALNLNHDISLSSNNAKPSNALGTAFDGLEFAGTALGGAFLLKRGIHNLNIATNKKSNAINNIAHSNNSRNSIFRVISSASILATSAGVLVGTFMDIDKGVSQTQSTIAQLFNNTLGPKVSSNVDNFVISDNPKPDMLNNLSVNPTDNKIIRSVLSKENLKYIPAYRGWETGNRPNSKAEIEFMTLGLPQEVTKLPNSKADCSTIYSDTSAALGLKVGQKFELEGLDVTVKRIINGNTGFNLLPLIINNQDFANCLSEDKAEAYSMILTQAPPGKIRSLMKEINKNQDPANRLYAASSSKFIQDALLTGENAVNGPVLEIMLVGLLFAGIALSYKARTTMANSRKQNLMLKANGFDEHLLSKIYTEINESEIMKSSLFALPAIFIVDTMTNMAEPGAALGPDAKTYLTLLGLTWGVGRISTAYALRREAKLASFDKGQEL